MKYQIWGFSYLANYLNDGINILTGNKDEYDYEFEIPCFDGLAYFKLNNHYYVIHYPVYKSLTDEQKHSVRFYCGYEPEDGEYGVICGALGVISEISESAFNSLCVSYPLSKKEKEYLNY